jgi:hypothetical protein
MILKPIVADTIVHATINPADVPDTVINIGRKSNEVVYLGCSVAITVYGAMDDSDQYITLVKGMKFKSDTPIDKIRVKKATVSSGTVASVSFVQVNEGTLDFLNLP